MKKKLDELTDLFAEVEKKHWWFIGRRTLLHLAIQRYARKKNNLKILDVGCGTGGTMLALQQYGKVWGIDISKLCIDYCKKNGLKNVQIAGATKLPFKENTFDIVLMLDVIEHVKNDNKAMAEAKRVLKPNGLLLITIPALPLVWSVYDTEQGHHKRYLANDLRVLAQNNQLHIHKITYFNFILSIPIAFIRYIARFPAFARLTNYESSVNLNIAHHWLLNKILTIVFNGEIWLTRFISYPFGISLFAVFRKNH